MNRRKIQVVNHALSLFIEQGIMQTSIQDIIHRAGISKGTFYNYFTSKNECVSAVLEQVRYDTTMRRSEFQIGKDAHDLQVLIEQIAMTSHNNQRVGISALFEEILHSNDKEMKQYVMFYRYYELEWLADRLVDVYGEMMRNHAFEAAVIFYGIQQHLLFTARNINQTTIEPRKVNQAVFQYMSYIVECLKTKHTSVIDAEHIDAMKSQLTNTPILQADVLQALDESTQLHRLTKPQADLTEALRYELYQQPLREAVIHALLQPYLDAFNGSTSYNQAKEIVTMIWRYIQVR